MAKDFPVCICLGIPGYLSEVRGKHTFYSAGHSNGRRTAGADNVGAPDRSGAVRRISLLFRIESACVGQAEAASWAAVFNPFEF